MAKRTYAPQMARICQRLAVYYSKHQVAITNAVGAGSQLDVDAQALVARINATGGWGKQQVTEQP